MLRPFARLKRDESFMGIAFRTNLYVLAGAAYVTPVPFPFVVAYVLVMVAQVALGIVVLAAGLLLTIWPSGRRTGRRLAGGIIGSFPFVLFFQGLSLPLLTVSAVISLIFGTWFGSAHSRNMVVAFGALGLMVAFFVAASVTGFITGWGVGARIASGTQVRDALRSSRALRFLAASLTRFSLFSINVTPERGIAVGLGIIFLTAAGLVVARTAYVERCGIAEITYRGQQIRLAKKYIDYDDYKNDPFNLASSEIPRVEKLMTEARIGPDFVDRKDFINQVFKIKFPGYGVGPVLRVAAIGREFIVEFIEIPQVAKERYFVLERMAGGALHLIDDFVMPHDPWSVYRSIWSIRLVDDRLVYSDRNSRVLRETPAAP
jgi:hypothetical protein